MTLAFQAHDRSALPDTFVVGQGHEFVLANEL